MLKSQMLYNIKTTISFCFTRSFCIATKATTSGTKSFIAKSNLPLHHYFQGSKLYVNPVIISPPKIGTGYIADYDEIYQSLIGEKRSNCFYVYNYKNNDNIWFIEDVLSVVNNIAKRDEIVCIAGLGLVRRNINVSASLEDARKRCRLEAIDMAILECDDSTFANHMPSFERAISELENEVINGSLTSYGIQFNVQPYNYHTPPLASIGTFGLIPPIFEQSIVEGLQSPNLDLILYPLCPSHSIPATYPVLNPSLEDYDPETLGELESVEKLRKYSRAAVDPLLCYPGKGKVEGQDQSQEEEDEEEDEEKEMESMESLENKLTAEYEASEKEKEASTGITGELPTPTVVPEEAASPPPTEPSHIDDLQAAIPLLSGLYLTEVEAALHGAMEELCPRLVTSRTLEEKALRVVLAVGVDVVVVDVDLACHLDKFSLRPQDLLVADDVEELFGSFCIPESYNDSN